MFGTITEKTCRKCQETKPVDQFFRHKNGKGGYGSRCKNCEKGHEVVPRGYLNPMGKMCTKCRVLKPYDEFYTRDGDRPFPHCKECHAAIMKARYDARTQEDTDRVNAKRRSQDRTIERRRYRLEKIYKITEEQYDLMVEEQDGRCAICSKTPEKLHIDHCHTSNQVRGLLCQGCNLGLGGFRDNPEALAEAVKYLERHALV